MKSFSKFKLPMLALVAMLAVGCSSDAEKAQREAEYKAAKAKAEEMMKNPEVELIGNFDGCEVKYYRRGHFTDNFYISKCSSVSPSETTTQTGIERVGSGKHLSHATKFDITHQISALDAKKAELEAKQLEIEKEKAALQKKNELAANAKEKLTSEEREALGLK